MTKDAKKPRVSAVLSRTEREDQALQLKLQRGLEYREIARRLDFKNAAMASRAVDRAIRRLPNHTADEDRLMLRERLEYLYRRAHDKLDEGGSAEIKAAAGIVAQQARLNRPQPSRKAVTEEDDELIPIAEARKLLEEDHEQKNPAGRSS